MKLNKSKKSLGLIILLVIIVLVSIAYYVHVNNHSYENISYKQFIKFVEKNKIEKVILSNDSKIEGKLEDGTMFITDNPRIDNFKEKLLLDDIKVEESDGKITTKDILTFIFFIFGIGLLVYYLKRNTTRQAEKEITSMSNIDNDTKESKTTFNDVAGNDEAKESLREVVDFIQNPKKYERYGARLPRGILLYGSPGTGKTLLARALAGEANVPFFAVTGSDFIQVYAGLGASRIRDLFKKARKAGKCVIFIDEIDALGKKRRGGGTGGNDESDRTLNALLTEMSGFNGNEGIVVIGATNRIDTLDSALLRPGRFDRQIEVGLPDVNARYKILKLHSKNKPLASNIDFRKIAQETVYFSGAKLENLMNESAMIAAKNNKEVIDMKHIDKAFYNVIAGEEKKDKSCISNNDKKITAYHEAGHALITKLVSPQNKVTKVTIIPSTKGAGGFSMNIPPDKMYQTKEELNQSIMTALGGRAAEEIILGENKVTTGASNDLKKATEILLSLIGRFGMDKETGLINYEAVFGANSTANKYLLDRTKQIIAELYSNTKKLIVDNKNILHKIANELIEKETLSEQDINNIVKHCREN